MKKTATIVAKGDRQSVEGVVIGDERYIPSVWSLNEGVGGAFVLDKGNYVSYYTPHLKKEHTR